MKFYFIITYLINFIYCISSDNFIKDLKLFGTHNSGSYAIKNHFLKPLKYFSNCQSLTIEEQLNKDVQIFDLRIVLDNNEFYIYHGFIRYDLTLKNVFEYFIKHLNSYPKKFIIAFIKYENKYNNNNINKIYYEFLLSYKNYIYNDTKEIYDILESEMSSKILLLSRTGILYTNLSRHMDWEDNQVTYNKHYYIQDIYYFNSNIDFSNKYINKKIDILYNDIKEFEYNKINLIYLNINYLFPKSIEYIAYKINSQINYSLPMWYMVDYIEYINKNNNANPINNIILLIILIIIIIIASITMILFFYIFKSY